MKKLGLIIPLLKHISFYFLTFTWFVLLIAWSQVLYAQTNGCHIVRGMSDVIYYTPYGAGSPSEWTTTGVIDPTGAQGGFHYDNTATFGCIRDIGGLCTIYQQYEISPGPPQVVGTRVYETGVYASINPTNCPIDDYIPLLFIFTAGIAFFQIRKRQASLKDENLHHYRSL